MVASPVSRSDAVPRHVAVIMDANGRWAAARGLSRADGHSAGTENIRLVVQAFADRGVQVLTLFAFSTENWRRPIQEVRGLMHILSRTIRREVEPLHEAGVRLRYIGRLERLEPPLRREIKKAVELTRDNTKMTVCVAFNYGGRAEVVDAVRRIVDDGIAADQITEQTIGRYLYTEGLPDPDLIIRTGGELRVSNFLIWQAAYAEYYFTPTYWPDFAEADVDAALTSYAQRLRKFGGLAAARPDQPGGDTGANNGNGR